MGQLILSPNSDVTPARLLEEIVAADISHLKPGKMRYTQLLNEQGGMIDDIMVTCDPHHHDQLLVVVNGACKEKDYRYFARKHCW